LLIGKLRTDSRERGLNKKIWDEAISELIVCQSKKTWEKLIDKNTSEAFLIEMSLKDPMARKEILRFIKQKGAPQTPA